MATMSVEERLATLETEVAGLKKRLETQKAPTAVPWWEQIRGTFKDDPLFDEAMRLGREWRESQKLDDNEDSADDKSRAHAPA